jgi:RNA polymerase sigma-70 factor, ECF subfamily
VARYSSISTIELISICAMSRESAAWEEFVKRFHRPIGLSVVRTAKQWGVVQQQVIQDLVQETYVRLWSDGCRHLLEFGAEHPDALSGYIKTIAANLTRDHFKHHHSKKRGSGAYEESVEKVEPHASEQTFGSPSLVERQILLKEIDQYLKECSVGPEQERDRQMFWFYYQHGLSAKAIAALPMIALSEKGVESALSKLTHLVRDRIAAQRLRTLKTKDQKGFQAAESY